MLKEGLHQLKQKIITPFHEQQGQSLIVFVFSFVGLVAMLGLAIDLGLVYIERVKLNKAIDAAVLASVVELPFEEDAMNRSIEFLRENGYDVGDDVIVKVRGCVTSVAGNGGNVNEDGILGIDSNIDQVKNNEVVGYDYVTVDSPDDARTIFSIDTGAFRGDDAIANRCDETQGLYGTSSRIKISGESYVDMNFMKLLGFDRITVYSDAVAESINSLDIMVVFDLSGSMESDTACIDCWVKTEKWTSREDVTDKAYPTNNGYYNPLPFNPEWDPTMTTVPQTELCTPLGVFSFTLGGVTYPVSTTVPYDIPSVSVSLSELGLAPDPDITDYMYSVHEAELYSSISPQNAWNLAGRTQGQGFWSLQRGTMNEFGKQHFATGVTDNGYQYPNVLDPSIYNGAHKNYYFYQGNQAGNTVKQSANLCHPGIDDTGSDLIDCKLGVGAAKTICEQEITLADGSKVGPIDCSSYIQAKPWVSYWPEKDSQVIGGAYDINCFPIGVGNCWQDTPEVLYTVPPYVEYDFTNKDGWGSKTHIWVRAVGGGHYAYEWLGYQRASADPITGDRDWHRSNIYWEVFKTSNEDVIQGVTASQTAPGAFDQNGTDSPPYWRDTRVRNEDWEWVYLGEVDGTEESVSLASYNPLDPDHDRQYTLRIYQGSAGYKIDRIVFTNNPAVPQPVGGDAGADADHVSKVLMNRVMLDSSSAVVDDDVEAAHNYNYTGPKISRGSATREACNACNPAYGLTVSLNNADPKAQCSCKRSATSSSGRFGGDGCTVVPDGEVVNQLNNDLYSGLQPFRSAQEAVKNFTSRLDPQFDQFGFIGFSNDVVDDSAARSKLQCLNYTASGNEGFTFENCYQTDPITYTNVIKAVENQWPLGGTNMAAGIREGLEELGVDTPGNAETVTSNCSATEADGNACHRVGTSNKIIILLTDGIPTDYPGSTSASGVDKCSQQNSDGNVLFWDGEPNDKSHQCAMFYAQQAAANNVALYTIGLGGSINPDLLEAMATGSYIGADGKRTSPFFNGQGRFYPAASPLELDTIFQDILDQIYVRIVG
ncbi:pilus assembly protein TadG-related protein [Anaerolineales bacterium HSG6]|nr:pilus assembly protein TadG-related protein [Anaerolineales bacterium HSG6]